MRKLKVSLVTFFVFLVTLGVFNEPSVMAQHEGHTTPPKPAATLLTVSAWKDVDERS